MIDGELDYLNCCVLQVNGLLRLVFLPLNLSRVYCIGEM